MATKIRLQRHGRKGHPVYRIVVADSRAPRDGKFIEKLGVYNPNTHPATIDLNFERSLHWIGVGAQPTDTAKTILSREGVLLMHHLNGGVKKGAFAQEEANKRFEAWLKGKKDKMIQEAQKDKETALAEAKKRHEQEKEQHEARAKELEEKRAAMAKAQAEAEAAQAASAEEAPATEETPAEEVQETQE